MTDPSTPSGWFPDPLGRYDHRYFNGTSWTSDVSKDGTRYVDPLGADPGTPQRQGNRAATAAVVLGSLSIAIAWMPFIVVAGIVLAVLAIVFGIRGLRRSREHGEGRRGAIAGTVMGVLGLGVAVVGVVLTLVVWNAVVEFAEPGPHDAEITSCEVDGREVTVTGTIVNGDDVVRDYTVFVEIAGRTEATTVEDVPPGAPAEWVVTVTARSVPSDCDPEITVQGPFPFDIEVDPVGG